jgi:hypothetical protein
MISPRRGGTSILCARRPVPATSSSSTRFEEEESEVPPTMDVTFRISGIPSTADATRKRIPFAVLKGTDLVLKSPLGPDASVNEHLVWLWGMLKHRRRYLKSLAAQGAKMTAQVKGFRRPIEIKPNGPEMLHLLGVTLTFTD